MEKFRVAVLKVFANSLHDADHCCAAVRFAKFVQRALDAWSDGDCILVF